MSDQMRVSQKRIKTMHSLKSIIRTMKILSAMNIISYKKSVKALQYYYENVKLGLLACFLQSPQMFRALENKKATTKRTGVIIFGSDQGLVGQFNDQIADFAYRKLEPLHTEKVVWPVGERVFSRLADYPDLKVKTALSVPTSIPHITTLMAQLLDDLENEEATKSFDKLLLYYNEPLPGGKFAPAQVTLMPLDEEWVTSLTKKQWPTKTVPEVFDDLEFTFLTLIRQHLFTSIIQACTESLASENACRLASMQLAEKHIEEELERQLWRYNQERQHRIDEELFDVFSGFEVIRSTIV